MLCSVRFLFFLWNIFAFFTLFAFSMACDQRYFSTFRANIGIDWTRFKMIRECKRKRKRGININSGGGSGSAKREKTLQTHILQTNEIIAAEKGGIHVRTETNTTRWKMLNSRVQRNNAAEKFFMGPLPMLLQPSFASSHIHFRWRVEREKNFFSAKHAIVLFVFFLLRSWFVKI